MSDVGEEIAALSRRMGELEHRQNVLEAALRWTFALGPCCLLLIGFVVVRVS